MVYADEAAHSKEISQVWQQYYIKKYFEATGANRSCGNSKETILLGRRIAAQRIVIDTIHLLNKYELHKIDSEMPTLIDGALFKSSISR